jgi:cell division transport system permease protein
MVARLAYFLRTALRGMRRSPLRTLLCAGTIAAALAVLGGYLLVYGNLESVLGRWGRDLDLSVYLKDQATDAERADLATWLRARPEVAEVRAVSRTEALERLRLQWPQHGEILAGLGENPAEASLEVRLGPVADLGAVLAALARALEGRAGVAAVEYGQGELVRIEAALDLLRSAGTVLAGLLAFAALFVAGATIRLAIRDRRDELEIMKLCGATDAFIRAPLYLEGAFQGVVGGLVALGLVAALRAFLGGALQEIFALPGGAPALAFLSTEITFGLVAGGALLGALGSAVAAGRYLRG